MISEDFAFFGFDETSWNRLVSLFLGEPKLGPRGVLVVVVDAAAEPVASFHTALGSIDPAILPDLEDLEALCEFAEAGACIVMRKRAMADVEPYLAKPLDPDQDFVTRVMRFVHVLRELGNGNWVRVYPNPLPNLLLSAAPAAKPLSDLLLPAGHSFVLGVFESGELWTGAVLRRSEDSLDVFAGPNAMSEWAGPLGGAWHRDHRVLTGAIARELGPVHLGLFMERPTAERLLAGREAGEWALAYASRELMIYPLPGYAAAALGLDVLRGAAQYVMRVFEDMEPEEIASIAQGFWRGLTDGKGVEGLVGFSPLQLITGVIKKASSEPAPPQSESEPGQQEPATTQSEPAPRKDGRNA